MRKAITRRSSAKFKFDIIVSARKIFVVFTILSAIVKEDNPTQVKFSRIGMKNIDVQAA